MAGGNGIPDYSIDGNINEPSPNSTPQVTVVPRVPDPLDLGQSYPASPIHNQDLGDVPLKEFFLQKVMRGPVNDGGYWGFNGTFNRDYNENSPPAYNKFWQSPGDPKNPFEPNINSPENSDDPASQPGPNTAGGLTFPINTEKIGSAPFVGLGTMVSPKFCAVNLVHGELNSFGNTDAGKYILGKSGASGEK